MNISQYILDKAVQIRLLIFDVDGVLTDGRLYFGNDGNEYKAFYSRDGHGIKMLQNNGVTIAIISGRQAASVERRLQELGVYHAYLGVADKTKAFQDLLNRLSLHPEQVAYVGDDLIDLPLMRCVGLAIAVEDADPFVCDQAHWRTSYPGGRGAAREVCELILQAQDRLEQERNRYL